MASSHFSNLEVLVAEDNPLNQHLILAILDALGVQAVVAGDGEAAVAAAAGRRFDLILTDLCMPRMDGLEATRRIRAAEARAASAPTPIYMVTSHDEPEMRAASFDAGADGHIAKPFRVQSIVAALSAALSLREGAPGGATMLAG